MFLFRSTDCVPAHIQHLTFHIIHYHFSDLMLLTSNTVHINMVSERLIYLHISKTQQHSTIIIFSTLLTQHNLYLPHVRSGHIPDYSKFRPFISNIVHLFLFSFFIYSRSHLLTFQFMCSSVHIHSKIQNCSCSTLLLINTTNTEH